jgi:hypothetical protein
MNSENFGVRITENGAWNQKIWALEAFRGKTIILGGSGQFWNLLSGWRVLAQKTGALANFGDFSGIFVEFWRVSKRIGTATQFTTSSGGFNGKTRGPGPRSLRTDGTVGSTVDREWHGQWARWRTSARGHRCSLTLAEEDEQGDAKLEV